jgi:glutamate dehydrogenase
VLVDYLPTALREDYAQRMADHPLRREIVVTQLVSEAVNRGGTSFFHRAVEETGASPDDVLRAYVIVREVYRLPELWQAIEALDNRVPCDAQTSLFLELRRLLDRAVRWLVTSRHSPLDVPGEIARLQPGVGRLLGELGTLLREAERTAVHEQVAGLTRQGVPEDVASRVVLAYYGFRLLDIVETAHNSGHELDAVATVYSLLFDRFRADILLTKISALPRQNRWQTSARMALRHDMYQVLAVLTARLLAATTPSSDVLQRMREWERANAVPIRIARTLLREFDESPADLAALSVLLRQIRTLVRTSAT